MLFVTCSIVQTYQCKSYASMPLLIRYRLFHHRHARPSTESNFFTLMLPLKWEAHLRAALQAAPVAGVPVSICVRCRGAALGRAASRRAVRASLAAGVAAWSVLPAALARAQP